MMFRLVPPPSSHLEVATFPGGKFSNNRTSDVARFDFPETAFLLINQIVIDAPATLGPRVCVNGKAADVFRLVLAHSKFFKVERDGFGDNF